MPVCLMDDLDWEEERRRRGFPGQIEVGDPRLGGGSGGLKTADESGRISVLTGIGKDDEVSALGEPPSTPASPAAAAPAGGRGEGEWEVRGVGAAATPDDVRDAAREEEKGEIVVVVGRPEEAAAAEGKEAPPIVVGAPSEERGDAESRSTRQQEEEAEELARSSPPRRG